MNDLQMNIQNNRLVLISILKKNPNLAFTKINELAYFVGRRYNVSLQIHFPDPTKINDPNSYGTENIGVIVDKFRKKFPISRESIKIKAMELRPSVEACDAYMYEGKEGVRLLMKSGRIEIQPGGMHIWCKLDDEIISFLDWLMLNVYLIDST